MDKIQKIDNELVYSGFKLLKNGLEAIGTPTFEQWNEAGNFIKRANGAVHFWIGDWLNYGEHTYGEKYTQAIDETSFNYGTLRNDAYVAKHIDLSRRRDNLDWGIYQEVAPFEPNKQEELLKKAKDTKMTVRKLRKQKHKILLDNVRPNTTTDENLILGDSITELGLLPDDSIDCVITDPPYGIDYQSNFKIDKFEKIQNDKENTFILLDKVCAILQNKIKINSHLYFFTSWKVLYKHEEIIGKYFDIKNLLVWEKNNWSMGDLEGNYAEQYELIIFANKGRRILNGNRETNILHFDRVVNEVHPTQKPIPLIEYLIEKSTNEGELVCDPFMGSGSTCRASKNKNRRYFGIEIDKNYFEVAKNIVWV